MTIDWTELARLPAHEAYLQIRRHEIAYANAHFAARVLELAKGLLTDAPPFDSVVCWDIAGERLLWRTEDLCDVCGGIGHLYSENKGRSFDCPACDEDIYDDCVFTTDYDGTDLRREED